MLENIFTLVFGKLKNNKPTNGKASIRGSQHDSTGTTGGRSTGGSTQISGPYTLTAPQTRTLPYIPSHNSSTPISFAGSNPQNGSFKEDNNNIYTMPNATMHRHTPVGPGIVSAMDDLSALDDPFKRTAKARMSLPIMQPNRNFRSVHSQVSRKSQLPAQSMGHIYLQHNGETKQAFLPNELTAIDTIWALFVCAFPNMLTMEYMSQPFVKIYIYNPNCNIFYELRDIDEVRHESVLRIHQSDPILALPLPYNQMRYTQQIPPPKPRRMIPVNQLQPSPNALYGYSGNSTYNPVIPMQFPQRQPSLHHQQNPLQHQQPYQHQQQAQQKRQTQWPPNVPFQ